MKCDLYDSIWDLYTYIHFEIPAVSNGDIVLEYDRVYVSEIDPYGSYGTNIMVCFNIMEHQKVPAIL